MEVEWLSDGFVELGSAIFLEGRWVISLALGYAFTRRIFWKTGERERNRPGPDYRGDSKRRGQRPNVSPVSTIPLSSEPELTFQCQ
jgi:hypothetical protein